MRSAAATVEQYLRDLSPDRREVIRKVRDVILRHLPDGYAETMNWGMISYEVPLARYPKTRNKQPLSYAGLAAQKNYFSVYLMSAYRGSEGESRLHEGFRRAGKTLDMGKCCIRFKRVDDVALDAIGEAVASTPVDVFIALFERSRPR